MREVESFIGGEKINQEPLKLALLLIEVIVFVLFGTAGIFFFFTHPNFPQSCLALGKTKAVFSLLFILTLSPFGAHLFSAGLERLWETIKNSKK